MQPADSADSHATRSAPLVPVILAGGVGSRLWPLSRALFPKQFQPLLGDLSLLQATLLRAKRAAAQPPIIVCNEAHRFAAAEQCRALQLPWQCIALEPEGRNTAPAIALAAHLAAAQSPDARLLVLPADHVIQDEDAFEQAIKTAADAAGDDQLVAFGVTPTHPETGYGYIELSAPGAGAQPLRSFVEKPDRRTAAACVASGRHLWNSGMYLLGARTCLAQIEKRSPAMAEAVAASVQAGQSDLDFFRPSKAFLDSPAGSFDKVVMERADNALVVPVSFGWRDVGSWRAIQDAVPADADGNLIRGDVMALDVANSLIHAQGRLIGAIGVRDLIIVETNDAVLVANRERTQQVGALAEQLKRLQRSEYLLHRQEFRPWGSWESLASGARFNVKQLRLKPGASTSLQRHQHRAEHWVVVGGVAEVARDGETFTLTENSSIEIPQGAVHRLRNPGESPLEIIEIQIGAYLGEDDIVRFEDEYGRTP